MCSDFWKFTWIAIAGPLTALFLVSAQAAETASSLMAKGELQWEAGNLDKAQKYFELAVRSDPASVRMQMKLGGLQLSRNEFSGSIQTYQRVIGLDPKNALAWIGLGIAYLHTGGNELSRAAFEEAVRIDPGRREQLAAVMTVLNKSD